MRRHNETMKQLGAMMKLVSTVFAGVITGLSGFAVLLLIAFLFGFFVMILWNFLFVGAGSILGALTFAKITWFQGFCLAFLCGLLFKDT